VGFQTHDLPSALTCKIYRQASLNLNMDAGIYERASRDDIFGSALVKMIMAGMS